MLARCAFDVLPTDASGMAVETGEAKPSEFLAMNHGKDVGWIFVHRIDYGPDYGMKKPIKATSREDQWAKADEDEKRRTKQLSEYFGPLSYEPWR